MPLTTLPKTVYWPSRKLASAVVMKNWELNEFGSCERAAPSTPRWKLSAIEGLATGLAELHVTSLGHEAVDDAVEHHAVVGAFFSQRDDALDMLGRQGGQQLDVDIATLD
jgi:hypothetical protein